MNDTEQRLAALLRSATPEPPSELSLAVLEGARRSSSSVDSSSRSRRWLPAVAAAAIVLTVAGVVTGLVVTRDRNHPAAPVASSGSVPSISPTPSSPVDSGSSSPPTVAAGQAPLCGTSALTASSGGLDRGAGQLYFTVLVQNTSPATCSVVAFPDQVVAYSTTSGRSGAVNAEVTDNGSTPIPFLNLAPGAKGSFVLHGANAYDGSAVTVRRLEFALSGAPGSTLAVVLPSGGMTVNGPAGRPVPVDVTAWQEVAPAVGGVRECLASDLTASSGGLGRGAGQLYFTVIVENAGATPCQVYVYPDNVTVYGTTGASGNALSAAVTDNGSSTGFMTLAPTAKVSFVLHGANAYDGSSVTIRALTFQLKGTGTGLTVVLPGGGMTVNGPSGQPVPVDVTAFKPVS